MLEELLQICIMKMLRFICVFAPDASLFIIMQIVPFLRHLLPVCHLLGIPTASCRCTCVVVGQAHTPGRLNNVYVVIRVIFFFSL